LPRVGWISLRYRLITPVAAIPSFLQR